MKSVTFTVYQKIEYVNMWVIYKPDWDKSKLKLSLNNIIGCNKCKNNLMMYPYNSPKGDIQNDLVGSEGEFVLAIDAWHEDHSKNEETILGRYQTV